MDLHVDNDLCLLIAWNKGYSTAIAARVVSLDTKSLVIDVRLKRKTNVEIVYNINAPNVDAAKQNLEKLKRRVSFVSWPGLGGNITVILYLIFLICGYEWTRITGIFPIDQIRDALITYVFKNSANAIFAMNLMVAAHGVEAIYVWALLRNLGFTLSELLSWLILTIFLGFPITDRAQLLSHARKSTSKKDE